MKTWWHVKFRNFEMHTISVLWFTLSGWVNLFVGLPGPPMIKTKVLWKGHVLINLAQSEIRRFTGDWTGTILSGFWLACRGLDFFVTKNHCSNCNHVDIFFPSTRDIMQKKVGLNQGSAVAELPWIVETELSTCPARQLRHSGVHQRGAMQVSLNFNLCRQCSQSSTSSAGSIVTNSDKNTGDFMFRKGSLYNILNCLRHHTGLRNGFMCVAKLFKVQVTCTVYTT